MPPSVENVIVVVVDALRKDRVGVYSEGGTLTPNIDSLAADGVVFENAFTATNATDPSVTSIQTGKDPHSVVIHHGQHVTDAEKGQAERTVMVPNILRKKGYQTTATGRPLGRWHKDGFTDYPETKLDVHRRRSLGQLLERISPRLRNVAGEIYDTVASFREDVTTTDEIDDFLAFLGESQFYGFIHMMDSHFPCAPDNEIIEQLLEERTYPSGDLSEFFETHQDNPYVSGPLREAVNQQDFEVGLERLFARYDGAVIEADRKVGRLIEGLEERNLRSETAIVVVSDHGESLDEHGIYFDHHGLYDVSIRVPMIISGPGISSSRRTEFVQLPDLAPTVLDLLDCDRDLDGVGQSLVPLLTGSDGWADREFVVFSEAHAQRRLGIRTERYKFIKHIEDPVLREHRGSSLECGYCNTVHEGERELYDLQEDPGETNNVIGEHAEQTAELESKLDSYFERHGPHPEMDGDSGVEYDDEEEVLDRLEDLGYL